MDEGRMKIEGLHRYTATRVRIVSVLVRWPRALAHPSQCSPLSTEIHSMYLASCQLDRNLGHCLDRYNAYRSIAKRLARSTRANVRSWEPRRSHRQVEGNELHCSLPQVQPICMIHLLSNAVVSRRQPCRHIDCGVVFDLSLCFGELNSHVKSGCRQSSPRKDWRLRGSLLFFRR